jgi:hypothetical protein
MPTQEITALAMEGCVILATTILPTYMLCFGGFREPGDDPPKPWRNWVCFLVTADLPGGVHFYPQIKSPPAFRPMGSPLLLHSSNFKF